MRSEDIVKVENHGRMYRWQAQERAVAISSYLTNNPLNVENWKEGLAFAEAAKGLADQ